MRFSKTHRKKTEKVYLVIYVVTSPLKSFDIFHINDYLDFFLSFHYFILSLKSVEFRTSSSNTKMNKNQERSIFNSFFFFEKPILGLPL